MIKKALLILLVAFTGYVFFVAASERPFGSPRMVVSQRYLEKGLDETGSQNIVTSVVVLYRGFDTLGEVTVLFLAATALAALISGYSFERKEKTEPSLVMSTASRYLFPLILLFGAYIFIHGHLTPGGGFPGGVVIASGFLLMFLAFRKYRVSEGWLIVTEGLAGFFYVLIGLIGLYFLGSFLASFLPPGRLHTLLSGGIIPLIYILIGFKVGSEMTGILKSLKGEDENG